jgi:hypothetical protein
MNWARANKLYRRQTTDYRFEEERLDRAERWLKARRRRKKGSQAMRLATKPAPADLGIYRSAVCKVTIIELPAAVRYRKVFAFLQLKPPDLVPIERWQQCIRDAGRFLARWGLEAERLGWSSADLFGLAAVPEKPRPSYSRLSRYDQTGLCWLLEGRAVVALTADTASIRHPTGSVTVYRKHNKPALGPLGDSLDDLN